MALNRLVISASPREKGRSAMLAQTLCDALRQKYPCDNATFVSVCNLHISFCQGCGACEHSEWQQATKKAFDARAAHCDAHAQSVYENMYAKTGARCALSDDMQQMYELLDMSDELFVVSPVYYAGAPANFKVFLDRLQPYYWTDFQQIAKRPAYLYVVGAGGDPHGFVPLVGIVRSALAVAGFRLDEVHDWVGYKIEEEASPTSVSLLEGGRVHPASAYTCKDPYGTYPCVSNA